MIELKSARENFMANAPISMQCAMQKKIKIGPEYVSYVLL
jgi:hypothetical protein